MISMEVLITRLSNLQPQDLERWIDCEWVRADGSAGHYLFHEIDVARVRLIQELRDEMKINEDALPVVLSLLDQLYDQRRRLRELCEVLGKTAPEELRQTLARHLASGGP
jgi:chaperone modulatory protein CbpM